MFKTVSQNCNLNCKYCYYSSIVGRHNDKKLSLETVDKLISEYMKKTNGTASFIWQGGEPLLAGLDFFNEVVYLQSKYAQPNTIISNSIQTNGTLINREWANFFKKYNFVVGISVDGPGHLHDIKRKTYNGEGSFELVMSGVQQLRDSRVDFNVLTVLHQGNIDKSEELMAFYKDEMFTSIQFVPCMDFKSQDPKKPANYMITPKQYGDFLCNVFDIWYKDGSPCISIRLFENLLQAFLNRDPECCLNRKTCPVTLIVEATGDAYPCDYFINEEYKLGNINENSLDEIVNNTKYEIFLNYKKNLPNKCIKCNYLNLCNGGCPRNRNTDTPDYIGIDYFCESYLQLFNYVYYRLSVLERKIRLSWIQQYKKENNILPGRNDKCICGSEKKYKSCCGFLSGK